MKLTFPDGSTRQAYIMQALIGVQSSGDRPSAVTIDGYTIDSLPKAEEFIKWFKRHLLPSLGFTQKSSSTDALSKRFKDAIERLPELYPKMDVAALGFIQKYFNKCIETDYIPLELRVTIMDRFMEAFNVVVFNLHTEWKIMKGISEEEIKDGT